MRRFFVPISAGALAGCMLCFPQEAVQASFDACRLWAVAVLPGLFPFLICMLLVTGHLKRSGRNADNRFFGLPGAACPVLFMGWLSGSPGGARLALELYRMKQCGLDAMKRLALYTGTMSPMFIVATLGGWLGDIRLGWLMLLSHLLAAFITGQLSRFFFHCKSLPDAAQADTPPPTLGQVMQNAALAMLTVCGCMVVGGVAAKMVSLAITGLSPAALAGLKTALEVTTGCNDIVALQLPAQLPGLRPALVCAAVSFSGLSILLQNLAFYQETGVQFSFLFRGRLFHALLSFCLCYTFYPLAADGVQPAYASQSFQAGGVFPLLPLVWFCCIAYPLLRGKRRNGVKM